MCNYADPLGHTKKEKLQVQTGCGKKRSSREFGTFTLTLVHYVCILRYFYYADQLTHAKRQKLVQTGCGKKRNRKELGIHYFNHLCVCMCIMHQSLCRSITPSKKAGNASADRWLVQFHSCITKYHFPLLSPSGTETPQYRATLQSMEDIIRSIKATPSAHKTLCTKFKAKSWMDVLAKCSEEELVQSALVKIEKDSSNFLTFVTMLCDTPGLDIADIVEERMRELGELWYMYVSFFN